MKKQKVQAKINLEALAGGAFAEKLNEALMQVAENIQNPNTEATTKRQITVNIKFTPNKTRQMVGTQIAVTTKLAATEAIDTQMVMGVNMRTGQIEINGRTYCTKDLRRYDAADKAEPIKATTLTSLVDYIKESREELRDRMIIQVVSATKVLLYSGLLAERDRETLFEVNALLPQFEYGREYDQESFLVAMQSCFQKTDDREAVTIMASNIVNTQQGTFSDDGVSQQAIIKTGVTTKDAAFVPNPVSLIPYRTFLEVPQPASDFVFRISEGRGGAPAFKLVAADGGLWKSQAVDNVKNYLVKALADVPERERITIIA